MNLNSIELRRRGGPKKYSTEEEKIEANRASKRRSFLRNKEKIMLKDELIRNTPEKKAYMKQYRTVRYDKIKRIKKHFLSHITDKKEQEKEAVRMLKDKNLVIPEDE